MSWLLIILIILLALLLWILFIPIRITLNSEQRLLMIRVVSLGYAAILVQDNELLLRIHGFFLTKNIRFSEMLGGKSEDKRKKVRKKKKKNTNKKKGQLFSKQKRSRILRIIRIPTSFRITRFMVNIDSGDYIINAYLFPVFGYLDNYRPGWSWSVNYFGQIQVSLIAQTTLIRMIYSYLK